MWKIVLVIYILERNSPNSWIQREFHTKSAERVSLKDKDSSRRMRQGRQGNTRSEPEQCQEFPSHLGGRETWKDNSPCLRALLLLGSTPEIRLPPATPDCLGQLHKVSLLPEPPAARLIAGLAA